MNANNCSSFDYLVLQTLILNYFIVDNHEMVLNLLTRLTDNYLSLCLLVAPKKSTVRAKKRFSLQFLMAFVESNSVIY